MTGFCVSYAEIAFAHKRIRPHAVRTPVLTSRVADGITGAQLFFKCENRQHVGAFKFRGAFNALAQFTPAQLSRGVIAYSSGNHAQAIALAARMHNARAVIVMPFDAPDIKRVATLDYGAEIVPYDRATQSREDIGRAIAERDGLTLIPPFDHPHVIAGQGTAGKELFEETGPLDMLFVPLGGGGLLSGCALVARELSAPCRIFGVEPEAANDGQQSLRKGGIVRIPVPATIADGAQTQQLGQLTFPIIRALAEDILTVSDDCLVKTMRFFKRDMQMLVEPTGCLAAAALLEGKIDVRGRRVGVIVSGGNFDVARFSL
jgi:threonine dehydratase